MGRRLARFVVVGALACALGGDAAAAGAAGGKMAEASVKRLGSVVPGVRTAGRETELVDPAPIVLWAGADPAAVLVYRAREDGASMREEIAPIPESVAGPLRGTGAFPVANRSKVVPGDEAATRDVFHLRSIVTADLDGDGVDEVVVARRLGAVEAVAWRGALGRFPGPSAKAAVASYEPAGAQVASAGGKAVVHLLLRRVVHDRGVDAGELARIGAGDPYALVRADAQGVARVVLRDLGQVHEVLAVGALSRPGSKTMDELFAVFRRDEGEEVWLSRHRPDGAAIGAPRKVYVPFATGIAWEATFLPQSRAALLASPGWPVAYLVEPEAAVNWIRPVDLGALAKDATNVQHLGVADAGAKPKVVVRVDGAVYAVDADGAYWTASGGGWARSPKPAPFHRLASPSPQHGPAIVIPSAARGDEYLVVHGRAAGLQAIGRDEVSRAADLYLDPNEVAAERRRAEPGLDERDPVRDRLMREERERRQVQQEIRTVEEWRRLLPDSYAAMVKDGQSSVEATLLSRLTAPLRRPAALSSKRYRDPDGLRRWLASMDQPAETAFEVVRGGATLQSFRAAAGLGEATTELGRPTLDWRWGPTGAAVVATLTAAAGRPPELGVYLVRAASGAR